MWPDFSKFHKLGIKVFGIFLDGLFSICQTFVPNLAFYAAGQIRIVVNGQRLKSRYYSHLVTLVPSLYYNRAQQFSIQASAVSESQPSVPVVASILLHNRRPVMPRHGVRQRGRAVLSPETRAGLYRGQGTILWRGNHMRYRLST